jgi:integrase
VVARHTPASGGAYGTIIKLLILTGARRNEIGGMQWGEVDFGARDPPARRAQQESPTA